MRHNLAGLKIRAQRIRAGLTQSELARRAGISPSYLNLIECNKRSIAGGLVDRIAAGLGVERAALDGEAERRVVATLEEIASDPEIKGRSPDPGPPEDLVGRNPGWARLLLSLHRAWRDESQAVVALADRLNRDPFLGDSVHRMLTHAASISSAAEILETDDLSETERRRFLSIVSADAQRLSVAARSLLEFFDSTRIRVRSATPAEHVDAFILAEDNFFPEVENLAAAFLDRRLAGETPAAAAERLLSRRGHSAPDRGPGMRPPASRRFALVQAAMREQTEEALGTFLENHPALRSEESRLMAARSVQAYAAAAVLMPYDAFLEAAERWRYDIDALCRLFDVSYEQAAHRLATLRRPGAEGVRFAFMRSDASGYVTKRLPLPRLPLPSYGNACPLWMIHAAFQTPGLTARGFGELPSGDQFLFIARAVEKHPATPVLPRHLVSVMVACEAVDAARVIYGDGIEAAAAMAPVGTICRMCPRAGCGHRQEPRLIA